MYKVRFNYNKKDKITLSKIQDITTTKQNIIGTFLIMKVIIRKVFL